MKYRHSSPDSESREFPARQMGFSYSYCRCINSASKADFESSSATVNNDLILIGKCWVSMRWIWRQVRPAVFFPCRDQTDSFCKIYEVRVQPDLTNGFNISPKRHQADHVGRSNLLTQSFEHHLRIAHPYCRPYNSGIARILKRGMQHFQHLAMMKGRYRVPANKKGWVGAAVETVAPIRAANPPILSERGGTRWQWGQVQTSHD